MADQEGHRGRDGSRHEGDAGDDDRLGDEHAPSMGGGRECRADDAAAELGGDEQRRDDRDGDEPDEDAAEAVPHDVVVSKLAGLPDPEVACARDGEPAAVLGEGPGDEVVGELPRRPAGVQAPPCPGD
ncbi:MAG TPA: hypothetical protein VNC85_13615, partial [Mycobacteriales bacterium]|nr:hypothetical protein [Mycobacteriales bacterium]